MAKNPVQIGWPSSFVCILYQIHCMETTGQFCMRWRVTPISLVKRGNLDVYGFLKLANVRLYLFLSISTISLCCALQNLLPKDSRCTQVLAVTFTATGSRSASQFEMTPLFWKLNSLPQSFGWLLTQSFPTHLYCSVIHWLSLRTGHNITGNISCGKAVAKLALFILTGSLINSISTIIITVLLHFTTESGVALSYIISAIGLLSLYPTPILILMFLKPVRNKLKALLKCTCLHGHPSLVEAACHWQLQTWICQVWLFISSWSTRSHKITSKVCDIPTNYFASNHHAILL